MSDSGYDTIVVGGGPAGCAVALTLIHAGVSVALIERTRYEDRRWGETVPPPIRRPLEQLGVWERFTRSAHLPSLGVESYWGTADAVYRDFVFHPLRTGWHLDRRRFDSMLAEEAAARGVEICNARAVAAQQESGRWQVATTVGSMQSRLLINATGRQASFRMPAAGRRWRWDQTVAMMQTVESDTPPSGWTLVESGADGWAYSAPLPGTQRVVMCFTDPDLLRRVSAPDRRALSAVEGPALSAVERLAALPQTGRRLSGAVACGSPLLRSASAWCRSRVAGPSWLSVGEAASTVDPLSGQGLYRALADGIAAGLASLAMLAGDKSAAERFQHQIHSRFAADCRTALAYYRAERRWPDSPFWRRRHSSVGLVSGL